MAIESLKPTPDNLFRHHAGHDLESLLNTMLTLCHYTVGPSGKLRQATESDKRIPLNKWFVKDDRLDLACQKMVTLEAFTLLVEPYLPPYWADFAPFLRRLIQATYSEMPYLLASNIATHKAYRDILNKALKKYTVEEENKYAVYAAVSLSKRQREEPSTSSTKRQRPSDASKKIVLPALELHFLESFDEYGRSRATEDTTSLPETGLQDGDSRGGTDAGVPNSEVEK